MRAKRISIVLIVCMIFSLLITSCSKSNEGLNVDKSNDKNEVEKGGDDKGADSDMLGNMYKSGLPIVKDKVTLKMVAAKQHYQKDFNEMETFKELEQKTNVSIDWDLIPYESYVEKKNLLLASDNLPDAFFGTSTGGLSLDDIIKYGPQGVLIPLETYIDEYAPNINALFEEKPDVERVSKTPDGHIYTLPFVQELESNVVFTRMYINQTWLKELGLDTPNTTDKLFEALMAFRDKDPNGNKEQDEIPMSFMYKNHNNGHYGLFGSFGSLENTNHVCVLDNKVQLTPVTKEYKEGVLYFNRLYSEGLIDPEAFTHDSSQYQAKGSGSVPLYGVYFGWGPGTVGGERYENDYIPLAPPKGPNGDQLWISRAPAFWRGYFAITSKNQQPEITMRWANELYDELVSIQLQYGPLGVNLNQREDGNIEFIPTPSDKNYTEFRFHSSPGITASAITAETFANKIIPNDNMESDNYEYDVYKPYISNNYLPSVIFTEEQNAELATLQTDIFEYVNTMQARWITGDGSIEDEWESYITELDKMGIDKLQNIYQEAYDVFIGD